MTEIQWKAIINCDKTFDGIFFYALKSTKIFCRPSCTSRTPNPKNVEIFYTAEDAINHGYRPCNRCRPDCMEWQGAKDELTKKAQEYIDCHYTDKFSLQVIADNLYIDPCYLHRTFSEFTGYTLLQYQHQTRMKHAVRLLTETKLSASYISYEVGYNTLSHFSRVFKIIIGTSPLRFRNDNKK